MRRLLLCVGAVAFAAAAYASPALAQSETTDQTLDDCKLIPDDAARLACFDRVMKAGRGDVPGTGGDVSPVPIPQTARTSGGGGGSVATRGQASPPPMTAEEKREAAKRSFGLPGYANPDTEERKKTEVKELTTKVASVGLVGPNRLRITTTDGQVWDQTEGAARLANVGDTFVIKSGFMGAKICKVGSAQTYRCVRSDRGEVAEAGSEEDFVRGDDTSRAQIPQQASSAAGGPGGAGGGGAGGPGIMTADKSADASPPVTAEERREAATEGFGLPAYAKPGAEQSKRNVIKKLTTSVASVAVVGPNRLRITTSDGQVWDQTEGRPPPAKAGDQFTVRSGFMGSMTCRVGSARAYSCVRSDRPSQS